MAVPPLEGPPVIPKEPLFMEGRPRLVNERNCRRRTRRAGGRKNRMKKRVENSGRFDTVSVNIFTLSAHRGEEVGQTAVMRILVLVNWSAME